MISRNTYQRKDGAGNQVFIQIVINLQKGSTDRSTARPGKQQKPRQLHTYRSSARQAQRR